MGNDTTNYYEGYAKEYTEHTLDLDFHETQEKFLSYLRPRAKILDFGCGSGRDSKYFIKRGFEVYATDGTKTFCQIASDNTGIKVRHEMFCDLVETEVYDGIWACASILHLSYQELPLVFNKVYDALKVDGIFYSSFKYGDFEGLKNSRYFTYLEEERLGELIKRNGKFKVLTVFLTKDVRKGREDEKWINVILKK